MVLLVLAGFLGGLITGLSPCILPVLPAVLVAGGTGLDPRAEPAPRSGAGLRRRPVAVVAGIVVSFTVFTLVGSALLMALHLPQDLLRTVGLVVLGAVGVGMLVPPLGDLLERPFAYLPKRAVDVQGGAFVLGVGLGLLYVPCAGPVLAAITAVSASGHVGLPVVLLTASFAIGAGLPLLAIALAGERATERVRALREHALAVRRVSGVVLLASVLVLGTGVTDAFQRAVPGYTAALQSKVEGNASVSRQLSALRGTSAGQLANCQDGAYVLQSCGPAPAFRGISDWLNTPGGKPLSFASLRGKVVLVDFWTYSCINCQRTLPHLEAWSRDYAKAGLVVVGVHTPEFAFEHVPSNVRSAAASLGVTYPIAIDDKYATWNAYDNQYWPAEYLVDATGTVRHVHFGEGEYAETEHLIRELLVQAHRHAVLPAATKVVGKTASTEAITPESYLGYNRLDSLANPTIDQNAPYRYTLPATLEPNELGYGGVWTVGPQEVVAGADAQLALQFRARDVYLVLGGSGRLRVQVGDRPSTTVTVSGVPRLYTLFSSTALTNARLLLDFSPGVNAYAFTFG